MKTEVIYSDIARDAETRFDTSLMRQIDHFLKEKNKKSISLMIDELAEKIKKNFAALRAKTYSYLTDNYDEDKKAKKKSAIKRELEFEDHKHCLEAT